MSFKVIFTDVCKGTDPAELHVTLGLRNGTTAGAVSGASKKAEQVTIPLHNNTTNCTARIN